MVLAGQWSRPGGFEIVTQDVARARAEMGWQTALLSAEQMKDGLGQKVVMLMAPSIFLVYLFCGWVGV